MADDWTTMVNTGVPNPARIYDYLLDGKDNFPADRDVAEQLLAIAPVARDVVEDNRAFLRRAVRLLAGEAGIRQFIDLGSGIITTVLGTGRRGDGPEPDPLQCALSRPHGVHAAGGNLYVGDSEAHRIRVLS